MPNEKQPIICGKYFNKSLKAKEVLRLYKSGERNFQGVKLKGQSFKGQNLSEADFSEADLRSTNFSGANLKNTIFQEARTGLKGSCELVLCFNLGILLCILVAALVLLGALLIPAMPEILVSERLIAIGLIAGTILLAGAIAGAIIFEDAVSLIQVKESKQGKLGVILCIFLPMVVSIVISVVALFITAAQGFITQTNAIEGVLSVSLILILTYFLWEFLKQNEYLRSNWVRSLSINLAAIKDTSFRKAKLTGADFSQAKLEGADFREATLNNVCWHEAMIADRVRPGDTYLKNDRIRQLVISRQGQNERFDGEDLRNINLQNAILTNASFFRAKLNETNLQDAELSNTNFLEADLCGATLTGASIQDWNVNNQTNLEDIVCKYVFLKEGQKERLPHNTDRNFEPGEFAKYIEKAINTTELIFTDGIDWNAFLASFEELQNRYGKENLGIKAIEKKSGEAFVIRLEVPLDVIKADVESSFWQEYYPLIEAKDREIQLLSQQTEFYSQEIELKRKEIEVIRKDNTKLIGIIETVKKEETSKVNMIFKAPVYGVAGNVEGNQIIYTSQSLTDASTEIQNTLTKLQDKGLTQEQAEGKVAGDLATYAQNDSTALGNLVNWGKSLGNKAAETSVSEVVKRVIKLALNLAGFPIP